VSGQGAALARPGAAPAGAPPGTAVAGDELITVENLVKHFEIRGGLLGFRKIGAVRAVDGVSFSVRRGETLGLVGESGCGKSTLGRMVSGIMPATEGEVLYRGQNISAMPAEQAT